MPRPPNPSRRERRTALSEFLAEFRTGMDLTQRGLEERLGKFPPQYVSKLETGAIKKPTTEFLDALSKLTGKPVEKLRQLTKEPAPPRVVPTTGKFRLLFGHSLWGAPIYLAAARRMLPSFKVSSIGRRARQTGSPVPDFVWIDPEQPAPFVADIPRPSGNNDVFPLSAADIVDALQTQAADFAVIPGDILRDHHGLLLRVGTIMDSPSGCVLVVAPRNKEEGTLYCPLAAPQEEDEARARLTTYQLAIDLLAALRPDPLNPRNNNLAIGIDDGTVTAHIFDAMVASQSTKDERDLLNKARWSCKTDEFRTETFDALDRRCKNETGKRLVGIITWEPHATWVIATQRDRGGRPDLKRRPLDYSHEETGRPRHLSFDVVTLRTIPRTSAFKRAANELMHQVWVICTGLDGQGKDRVNSDTLRWLAHYFSLTNKDPSATLTSDDLRDSRRVLVENRYVVYWDIGTHGLLIGEPDVV